MKIAFATEDSIHINAHFGWAKKLDVYDINKEGYQFLESLMFPGDLKEDGDEDKLVPKLEALTDCTIVYVSAIGGSAAARLIRKNITPIKAQSEDEEIQNILNQLVKTLNGNPPPWLRKVLQRESAQSTLENSEVEEEEVVV